MQAFPVRLKIRNLQCSGRLLRGHIQIHHGVHEAALLGWGQSFDLQQ